MTVLEQGNITIHTENIVPIIKTSFYSKHEIFWRKLVSNFVDAIEKLKIDSNAGETSGELNAPTIQIIINKDKKLFPLDFSKNSCGIGVLPLFEVVCWRSSFTILTLMNEQLEYAEPSCIRQLAKTYYDFMPVPIKLDDEQIHRQKHCGGNLPETSPIRIVRFGSYGETSLNLLK